MTRQGSTATSGPCIFKGVYGISHRRNRWSGREDSNLRPLPPERVAPRRTRCFSKVFPQRAVRSDGRCSRLFHGRRFNVNLGPCLFGGEL
jgi:hypothetical protein